MKWINYHHLIYFREIARQGSISKASTYLKIGQPALSAQLKTLEEYIGVELFERRNRKLILTDAGKITLEYADKIGDLGQELIQVIEQKTFTQRIQFNVGAVDAIPKHLTSNIVDFAHKKTGCYLRILEGDPSFLLRELMAHQIDVIISDQDLMSQTSSKSTFSKKIIKDYVSAYGTKKFEHIKKNFPKSLQGAPTILPTSHARLSSDLDHYFHLEGIYLDKIAETQDTILQKILSTKGDGVIFLPELAAKELVKDKKLIKLGRLKGVFAEFYITYTKRIIENPALQLLLKQDFKNVKS